VFENRETNNQETLIILSDVHKLRKAEEESVLKSKQLSSFLYRTSHDLKNPVVCIEGLLTLYREGSTEEKEKCIDLIEVSNNRIKNILQSMAAVTRFNQHQPKLADVKICSIIEQVELQLKERKSPVQIISNITNEIVVHSDHVLLTFIFAELVINADRFRRPLIQNPVLELRYSYNNGNQYISFADNGIGIPEKVSGELFGIFFRGHDHSGAGMGLYSVKWICDHTERGSRFGCVRSGRQY
jgi:signal transduction histidine kinase